MQYCMICHKMHQCQSSKPVVCCNPLCIFRYSDLLPQNKKEKMRQVDRITICPFTSCEKEIREDANAAVLAALGDNINILHEQNQQNMLEMYAHRYLPNLEVIEFIEKRS